MSPMANEEVETQLNLRVHHLRFAVKDVPTFSDFLTQKMKFKLFAKKVVKSQVIALVFKHGSNVKFLVQSRTSVTTERNATCYNLCDDAYEYPADTVYDICLECNQTKQVTDLVESCKQKCVGGIFSQVSDGHGTVSYAKVKSPIGNIEHTLVDLTNYHGPFLPGFEACSSEDDGDFEQDVDLLSIDHIAISLCTGQTDEVVSWYRKYFGFQRALINEDDHETEGFTVQQNSNGLRLKEIICSAGKNYSPHNRPLTRLVFAESLNNDGWTQIDTLLQNHCGPGVQHIAFGCADVCHASSKLAMCGLNFIQYPSQYYSDLAGLVREESLKIDVDELRKNNALLEYHEAASNSNLKDYESTMKSNFCHLSLEEQLEEIGNNRWFIIQVFTKPVFPSGIFFEIIQRYNTSAGLGAGNISTIWKYRVASINLEKAENVQEIKS